MPDNWNVLDLVLNIILDLNSLLLVLQNTLVHIYPSPRTCEKLDFFIFFQHTSLMVLTSLLCTVSVFFDKILVTPASQMYSILTQHRRLRLASFTTSMSCDPEREMKTPS